MKLGTETGSLINHLSSGWKGGPAPEVGMGATILLWSDRKPATVIKVSASGKTVTVQEDNATRTDKNGMSEVQDYTFAPDPNGAVRTFRLGKYGWRTLGSGGKGSALRLGDRDKYHDFSF